MGKILKATERLCYFQSQTFAKLFIRIQKSYTKKIKSNDLSCKEKNEERPEDSGYQKLEETTTEMYQSNNGK